MAARTAVFRPVQLDKFAAKIAKNEKKSSRFEIEKD